jgi:hypothetical protein
MAGSKVTFSLDDATCARLERIAGRLAIPKSQVVREAIGSTNRSAGECLRSSTTLSGEFQPDRRPKSHESWPNSVPAVVRVAGRSRDRRRHVGSDRQPVWGTTVRIANA